MLQRPAVGSPAFWNLLIAAVLTGAALSVFFQESPGGCGDYPQNFQVLYIGMGAGLVAAGLFLALWRNLHGAFMLQSVLIVFIRYYLASIILGYGLAKVFASQFPHTMANMDARFAELSPMRVAWAFFGYSRGYQMFLGWGEVIPAVLLLFRRTTLIGALIMFVVMLNVFLINIFFDVCVKLNSGLYTVLALYILLQETPRLWNFFIANKIVLPAAVPDLGTPRWLVITGRVVKYGALLYILGSNAMGGWGMYQYANTHVSPTAVQGAWRATDVRHLQDGQWQPVSTQDSVWVTRMFFDGQNGVIRSELLRDRFRFTIDSATQTLTVNFTNQRNEWNIAPVKWHYVISSPDSLSLQGRWHSDSLAVRAVRRQDKLTRY